MEQKYSPSYQIFLERDKSFVERALPHLLRINKYHILEAMKAAKKPLTEEEKKNVMYSAIYSSDEGMANGVIEYLQVMREKIHEYYRKRTDADKAAKLEFKYITLILYQIKEHAFQDELVLSRFDFFRKKRNDKVIRYFLGVLLGKRMESLKDLTLKQWCDNIGTKTEGEREVVGLYLKQIKDSRRRVTEDGRLDFSKDGYLYPKDIEFEHFVMPAKFKRIYKDCKLDEYSEATYALHKYGLEHAKIARLFGKSHTAIGKKVKTLEKKPSIKRAEKEAINLQQKDLSDNEMGKKKIGRRSLHEDESEAAKESFEQGLSKAGKKRKSPFKP